MLRKLWTTLGLSLVGLGLAWMGACGNTEITKIAIQVEPLCVEGFLPGATQQFNARIFVDGLDEGIDNNAVTWSVIGGDANGSISFDGIYQAPNTTPPPSDIFIIQATSKEDTRKSGQAQVVMDGQGHCIDL